MQKKRTRWLVAGMLTCGVAAAATVWLWVTAVGINRNGYNLIREGMTLEEISAILGEPTGYYGTSRKQVGIAESDVKWWEHGDGIVTSGENWVSDYGLIYVGFSKDGKAVTKHFLRTSSTAR